MIPKGTVCRVKKDSHKARAGMRVVVNQEVDSAPYCLDLNGLYAGYFDESSLEPLSGLEAIKTGDELFDADGDERTVLGCCGEAVCLSRYDDQDGCGEWLTRSELKSQGYSVAKSAPAAKRPGYAYDDKDNEIGQLVDGKIIR